MAVTGFVVNGTLTEAEPVGTVIVLGTTPVEFVPFNATSTPPAGAAPVKVTVPDVDVPPVTEFGLTDIVEMTGAFIPSSTGLSPLGREAMILMLTSKPTG